MLSSLSLKLRTAWGLLDHCSALGSLDQDGADLWNIPRSSRQRVAKYKQAPASQGWWRKRKLKRWSSLVEGVSFVNVIVSS